MKPNLKILGTTAALAILVLGFQNCSPVNFGAGEQLAGKSGLVTPPVDDSLPDVDDNADDDVADGDDGAKDKDDKAPMPAPIDEIPDKTPDYDYADNSQTNPNVPPKDGDEFRAMCAESPDNRFLQLPARSQIVGTNSQNKYKAPSLKGIGGNSGDVVVLHDGTGDGTIGHINGNSARIIVCGFKIKSLNGGSNNVILVNSHVEKVLGNSSNIKLVDSTMGHQGGNSGPITIEEGK